jgi:hypothetical protein
VIKANCSIDEAYPAPNITWILDEHKVSDVVIAENKKKLLA